MGGYLSAQPSLKMIYFFNAGKVEGDMLKVKDLGRLAEDNIDSTAAAADADDSDCQVEESEENENGKIFPGNVCLSI